MSVEGVTKASVDQERWMHDADEESACSSEDIESPRSVVRKAWPSANVHIQVLRIREEDSRRDFVTENVKKIKYNDIRYRKADCDHVFIFSHTPINRPASPLSRSK